MMMKMIVVDRKTAQKAFALGEEAYIGYLNKDGGAWYSTEGLSDKQVGNTPKERFDAMVFFVKKCLLPHTRIKYAVYENSTVLNGMAW